MQRFRYLSMLACAALCCVVPLHAQDVDAAVRSADQHFESGKRAIRDGRMDEARREFDLAIESMLAAAAKAADRPQIQRHLDDLVDSIYRYDTDQLGAGLDQEEEETLVKRPVDDILEMTFPVDPTLRDKVRSQISKTRSQLPLEDSDAVLSFINFFQSTRGKRILENGLRQSGRYRDMIAKIFTEEGIPQELIFLAQEESGFQPKIMSYKLCVGLWQFSRAAGIEYGLKVNGTVDERMDPEKATRAAAKYLHTLWDRYHDWYLAMAAYDCGPGCVDKAVTRTGYADFWELRRRGVFVLETQNYVPIILAMTIVTKNASEYGIDEIAYESPLEYDTIDLTSPTNIALAAMALDLPVGSLREINPALRKLVAPAGYSLHVPKGRLPVLQSALQVVPESKRDSWKIHRVERGDTLASVAKRYAVTPAALAAANTGEFPQEGEFLAIPASYPGDKPPAKKTAAATKKPAVTSSKKAPAKRS